MIPKGLSLGDQAPQCPTPWSTLSPAPTSKPTSKRFKRLATRTGPKDDPFMRAQAESSPLIAIPDDDDVTFDTPCGKKGHSQRSLQDAKNRSVEHQGDDELASILENWQAFVTPKKSKRKEGHAEPGAIGPDLKATAKGSSFASGKRHEKHRSPPSASPIPGRTVHESTSIEQPITETDSPQKRPRRATAELTLKRMRSADEDDFKDGCYGLPPLKVKRMKLLCTPMNLDLEDSHESNSRPGTPALATKGSPVPAAKGRLHSLELLSEKRSPRTPHASISGLVTPGASATESPSPATSRRDLKVMSSPQEIDDSASEAGDTLPSTPASSFITLSSPITTPCSAAIREKKFSAENVQMKRKRGVQEAGLSPSHGESKRAKFAKPLADTRSHRLRRSWVLTRCLRDVKRLLES